MCGCGVSGPTASTEAEAITAWNTRADSHHRLVEALEWYEEQARLCRLIHSEGDAGRQALSADGGKRARDVLAALKEAGRG